MKHVFINLSAVFGFLSVALGAFGAHALKSRLDEYSQGIYQTAVQYQFFHTFAIMAVGILLMTIDSVWLRTSGWLFVWGTLIFSGSLYFLAFSGIKILGAITPIGGVLLLAGWICLLIASVRIAA